jgi:hypothetical protein
VEFTTGTGSALALFGGVLIWAVASLTWIGWQPFHHTLVLSLG